MHAHDQGLLHDLDTLFKHTADRRRVLRWLTAGGTASLPLVGIGKARAAADCAVIPEETAGPFPANGSNRNARGLANVLAQSGIVRSDIRSSFGGHGSNVAPGVPLIVRLTLVDARSNCTALPGRAIYIWHCTRDGLYSMYSPGATGENFLRGVQETDAGGVATFKTIVPGCYPGRIPHVHFEVYPNLSKATAGSNKIKTSQFTFPMGMLTEAYADIGYVESRSNLVPLSHASDGVFRDGVGLQMTTVTGTPATGYVALLRIAIAA